MQTAPIERYIEMVKSFGIEEAYKQRFRGTGRTTREILKLAIMMSEGKKIHVMYGDRKEATHEHATWIIHMVQRVCDFLGMEYEQVVRHTYHFPQSGGRITASHVNNVGGHASGWEQFRLHDN
ncbi:hypothetical protein RHEph02_gp030 [Rhizobium phage RHEph02]|uniref:Uncharacterized protein n=1 Tax=Rhizobium phage RHEph02 TaxID=1220602 RepID=L7TM12_9CAUD|nr:hypothetical protein HOS21_gp30 [Rhizobium phage RHEph02]AGC35597.1 hypothetical protein RHEph02_gp030 [Rhizobium phage RHEph02]